MVNPESAPHPTMSDTLKKFLADHPGRDLDRAGLALHYIDEGAGEPVVMVHGNPSWSILFRGLIDDLRDSHRVVALDHIGCGLSAKPDDTAYDYTLESRVDDLELLMDRLGLDSGVTLVVHDWGGMIGLAAAARKPERIARLVVCNTAAFHKPAAKAMPWAIAVCRESALGDLLVRGGNAFAIGTAWIGCAKNRMTKDVRAAYIAPYDSWDNRRAILRFVQDIPLGPRDRSYELVSWVESRLTALRDTPMLILWGMRDFVFDATFLEEWIRRFPKAEIERFADAGHYLFEDERAAASARVRAFLAASPRVKEPIA